MRASDLYRGVTRLTPTIESGGEQRRNDDPVRLRISACPSARRSRSPDCGACGTGDGCLSVQRRSAADRASRPTSCPCRHARTLNASHTPAGRYDSHLNAGRLHSIKVSAGLILALASAAIRRSTCRDHALLTMKALNGIDTSQDCPMRGLRAVTLCLLTALALSGCMRHPAPVAHAAAERSGYAGLSARLTAPWRPAGRSPMPQPPIRCAPMTPPTGSMPATSCGSWSMARKASPTPMRSTPAAPSPCR